MKKLLLSLLAMLSLASGIHAQCGPGQKQLIIAITPDNYPQEVTWNVKQNGVQIASGNFQGDTICVSESACVLFTIFDSANDGLCCGFGQGSYSLLLDGVQVASGAQYTTSDIQQINCPQGATCSNPLPIGLGTFSAATPNQFYAFTPTATGMYSVSTCGLTSCDTKIWIYGSCTNYAYNNDNTGTLFYDDDNGGCGLQAAVSAYMEAGLTYMVRIGLYQNATCAGAIPFEIEYLGEVVGCMDPTACNYNPLATSDNGTCVFYPHPDCPDGPDLLILEDVVKNSLQIRSEYADNCMVVEGCMNGYGNRTVLAFDTHIKNIGDMDYYVGSPTSNPDQFTFGNCHGHPHYEGYAEYLLYDPAGGAVPIGQKNGFCVMDLECNDGGSAQYGCGNMGISHQCGDIYNRDLDCQWIDITDVAPGEYIMAVKVNWDHSPDALGNYESNYNNNWAQVCIEITETNGVKGFTILEDCQPYTDCTGEPFGNAIVDCEGMCGGSTIKGDLDDNFTVQSADVSSYVSSIVGTNITATACTDLSDDGTITVWDAALASKCALHPLGTNNCEFPNTVQNPDQMVSLAITNIQTGLGYFDVAMTNPDNKVVGYEFNVSGVVVADVENLILGTYPITPAFNASGKIVGLSLQDSTIAKNTIATPFIRIYFSAITGDDICISSITHIVNNLHQPTATSIETACISVADLEDRGIPLFEMKPNPTTGQVEITVPSLLHEVLTLEVSDATGRVLFLQKLSINQVQTTIDLGPLANSVYYVSLRGKGMTQTQKIIKN